MPYEICMILLNLTFWKIRSNVSFYIHPFLFILSPLAFILLPSSSTNFYPVKYFEEISEANLTGSINLINQSTINYQLNSSALLLFSASCLSSIPASVLCLLRATA